MHKIPKSYPRLFDCDCDVCHTKFWVSRRCCRKLSPDGVDALTRFCCWGCAAKSGYFTRGGKINPALARTDEMGVDLDWRAKLLAGTK